MPAIRDFLQDCLELPWQPNSQDNPLHEKQVEELLIKHGLEYQSQPNGIQNFPDFRVNLPNGKHYVDVECKSSKKAMPTYNCGLPHSHGIYIFSSSKYNKTTVFRGRDVVSEEKRTLYSAMHSEMNEVLEKYRSEEDWNDDRGFDFFIRNMYTQKGGSQKTDYFLHKDRKQCEDNVINNDWEKYDA